MTEGEIEARIFELDEEIEEGFAELDELEIARELEYRVAEGFWEIEEDEDGEFYIFPVAEATYIEVPA